MKPFIRGDDMNPYVTVIARFRSKPGKEKDLRAELLALVAPTRAEDGCVNYDLHESNETPGLFFFYENWTTAASLARHLDTQHIKKMLGQTSDLLAEPIEIHQLTMLVKN
jgi:quinol monooxygenase YgiN